MACSDRPSHRLFWWLATAAGAGAVALFAIFEPSIDGPVFCLYRRALELPCPGCGLTRAVAHLGKGELAAAIALHPLAPLLTVEFVAGWLGLGLAAHGRLPGPRHWRLEIVFAATGCLLLAVWLGRMAIGDLTVLR